VPDEDRKRAAHRALVDRVLHGEGRASPEQRARAFSNADLPPPLHALIGKVATRPAQVTDADFAAAKASGFSEDQLFELVISAVLADLESAPVEDGLRATLRMLGKLTAEGKLSAEDMQEVLSAGVSPQQVEDALAVCAAFNTTGRLADAFGFELLSPEGFEAGAKYLLKRGYR
jgi:alkylhydroperoxidase family enzyme